MDKPHGKGRILPRLPILLLSYMALDRGHMYKTGQTGQTGQTGRTGWTGKISISLRSAGLPLWSKTRAKRRPIQARPIRFAPKNHMVPSATKAACPC